ncbi:MAG TPA: universal stress protein [Thermomicrobiales bacterium]|jgi:hypothetical protein
MVTRIVVPLTLSWRAEGILPAVAVRARDRDAEVVLLHVVPERPFARLARRWPSPPHPRRDEAAAVLDLFADRLRAMGVPARALVCAGGLAATIARVARRECAALVLLGQGAGLLPRGAAIRRSTRNALVVAPPAGPALPRGTTVRAFDADAARVGPTAPRFRGLRTVPLARVIGSVGRAGEVDAGFRLRTRRRGEIARFERVLRLSAGEGGGAVSPIAVYQLGRTYYVLDGHRRVAAAKALGHDEIAAVVTEYAPLGRPWAEAATAAPCGC